MRFPKRYLIVAGLLFAACETPGDPDFSLQQKVEAPVTFGKTIQFLGRYNAFIDTTSNQFDSLFTVGEEGLVSLSRQEDFDFGDLEEAVPVVNVTPLTFNSQIGDLELGDFSSSQVVGIADFNQLTGLDENLFSAGDPIPPGTSPSDVNISLNTDYFVSAVIEQGSLPVTFQNNLGLDIDQLTIALNSGGTNVDNVVLNNVLDNNAYEAQFIFAPGTLLEDLNVDLSASWSAQNLQRDPDNVVVSEPQGENLTASRLTASIPAQHFSEGGDLELSDEDFQFTQPDHYLELNSGTLRIYNLINQIDLELDTLQLSFPGIRRPPYNVEDSLVVTFEGLPGGSAGTDERTISLEDLRFYGEGNILNYNLYVSTENTQESGTGIVTIQSTDEVSATISVENLNLREAVGVLTPKEVLLNDDDPSNGISILDLSNDAEAEISELDGLEDISRQIEGLSFVEPSLNVPYQTNLGIETTVIGAILGTDENGNSVYLSGIPGSPNYVPDLELSPQLTANGVALSSNQLIKFAVDVSPDGSLSSGSNTFTTDNTNIDAFMNNLPTSIRFIGLARLNENNSEGILVNPVVFDPGLAVDIPLNLSVATSTYEDTTDADLQDLPGPDDEDQSLETASLQITYANGLPFEMDLQLTLLDEAQNVVTQIPLDNQEPLYISGGAIDGASGFVNEATEGSVSISLTEEQLDLLNRSREMIVSLDLRSTGQQNVKVRAQDSITLNISLSISLQSNIN